jgi:penicillin-binding protein 1A
VSQFDPDEQYFPTYKIESRARFMAVKEYEAANKTLDGEEKIFAATAAIAALVPGLVATIVAPNLDDTIKAFEASLGRSFVFLMLLTANTAIAFMFLIYCAEKYKSIVYAMRKIIVLRTLLGIKYGKIQWVMPVDRVDGAHDPYAIKMFPGWRSFLTFPALFVLGYLALSSFLITGKFVNEIYAAVGALPIPSGAFQDLVGYGLPYFATAIAIVIALSVAAAYRGALFDLHENWWGVFARVAGAVLRYPVLKDSEAKIYKLKMAVYEAGRMGLDPSELRRTIIHLEDRRFLRHGGVSVRSLAGAIFRYVVRRKFSGGSTISQQLARSIFVERMTPAWRRKLLEIPMAFWLEACFSKQEIIELYVCAVRYEHRVLGIVAAVKYFFPHKELEAYKRTNLSNAEIFFLVERLSNVRSGFLSGKIQAQIKDAHDANILAARDIMELIKIYEMQIGCGHVRPSDPSALGRLNQWAVQSYGTGPA